ncbi:MAG: DUF4831 family protein [Prevotella sp.]|nr:DUF4831 family protein [Prevotella sp.]
MKQVFFTLSLFSLFTFTAVAQTIEGTSYFLPKTALRLTLLVEKTTYKPGEFAAYAQRYMKKTDVQLEPSTTYRLIDTQMTPFALPDTAKRYTLQLDKRYSISEVARTDNGILLAINAQGKTAAQPKPFVAAPKAKPLNAKDYMNEDILTAGSTAKMAQLIAQEIYDIRDSRNQLQRGQAEFMPKDGQQLQIMMQGLDTQERALRQAFEGITERDTAEVSVEFIPTEAVERELVFRFSRHFGLVDSDDLSGTPYYISIAAEAKPQQPDEPKKKDKDDIGLNVNMPVKATATLFNGNAPVKKLDFQAPQFGTVENLSGALFGKKQTSQIVLNPVTGGLESIKEVAIEK